MFFRRRFPLFAALILLGAASVRAQDVRVRVFDLASPQKVAVAGEGGPVRLFAAEYEDALTVLREGESAVITMAQNQVHVAAGEMSLYARSLRIEPVDGSELAVNVLEGGSATEPKTYAGRLFVSEDGGGSMRLVNEVGLEDYVASVVAGEYGFDDLEGSKAMAVVIRTYTLGVLGKYGPEFDHVDHTRSQVYRGSGAVTPISRQAAEETEGQVLTYDGEPIRAVYFAHSGGHTADNENVWEGPPLPYLRGKPDPYGASSPHARWSTRLSRLRLLAALRSKFDADVEGFVIGRRSGDGRAATVELLVGNGRNRSISANEFRLLIIEHFGVRTVRSTLFDAQRDGDQYVFEGRGFGHGVGLSQWGARDMAQRGMAYDEILDFYYTDVELESLDGPARPPEPEPPIVERVEPIEPEKQTRRIGW